MGNNNEQDNYRNEIQSKSVRAGKRTYFFDVKATRSGDHYLTITESKKKFDQDGNFHFEKHKIFLYKEDFDKFKDGLSEVVDKINTLNEDYSKENDSAEKSFKDVEFEDLDQYFINNLDLFIILLFFYNILIFSIINLFLFFFRPFSCS